MERRAAYAAFEQTIIDLYDQDLLTLSQLDHVANHYSRQDIDSAGSRYLLTCDGKDLHQVCIELIEPTFPLAERGSSEDNDEYWERELRKWEEIVRTRWRWQAYCNPFSM